VESVSVQGRELTIQGRGGDLVTQVIDCVSEHRIRVIDLRTTPQTLEDVFLKLVSAEVRREDLSWIG
jgi:hypothetical protein